MKADKRILVIACALLAALHASTSLAASSAETPPAAPAPIVCDVTFYGRIVNATKPQKGLVSLTVVVDVVEKASKPICAPAGTFRVDLPSTHALVKETPAVRQTERKYRMTGSLGKKSETDLVVIGGAR